MPNVGSRYSKFVFEKKKKNNNNNNKKKKKKQKKKKKTKKTTTTAFGLEKIPQKTAEVGFLGSISQTRRTCIYERWTTGAGWCGVCVGESEQFDFYLFNTNDHRYPYLNSIYK